MNAAASPTFLEVEYDPACTQREFAEVLSALERWSVRTKGHVTYLRNFERHHFRANVIVAKCDTVPTAGNPAPSLVFQVMGRNLSQSGLGFLSPPLFVPRLLSDETLLMSGESAFQPGMEVMVKLLPKAAPPILVRGVVTRIRNVHAGFLEVGIAFIERGDVEQSTSKT